MSRVSVVAIVTVMFLALLLPNAATAAIPKGDLSIRLELVASGLISPIQLTHAGDGSGRLFIVDQAGFVRVVKDGVLLPVPFLDVSSVLPALNLAFDERGLLGLAFHPDYKNNGRYFVRLSTPRLGSAGEPCFATSRGCHFELLVEGTTDPASDVHTGGPLTVHIGFSQPQFNHNGGGIAFGPDGFLYFSLGDGGGAHDGLADSPPTHGPIGHGQNVSTALGAILRFDVSVPLAPTIPPSNPFAGDPSAAQEIYAYGFRNPYRFSFDDGPGGDGRLFVADVGQNKFEEVNIVTNGGNYGWVIREGFHCFDPLNPTTPPAACPTTGPLGESLADPVAEYEHADGLAVVGGFVYRGVQAPSRHGTYLFGDFSTQFSVPDGRLFWLDAESSTPFEIKEIQLGVDDPPYGRFLKGFGEDENGELYVLGSSDLGPVGTSGVVERVVFEVCDPTPQAQGYWFRQCLGVPAGDGGLDPGRNGRGPQSPTEPNFNPDLMDCAFETLEDLGFFGVATCEGMDADPPSDTCQRAEKQLTALILNVCSNRISHVCGVDVSAHGCTSTTVPDLLTELAGLIMSGDCHQANQCATLANSGGSSLAPLSADSSEGAGENKSSASSLAKNSQISVDGNLESQSISGSRLVGSGRTIRPQQASEAETTAPPDTASETSSNEPLGLMALEDQHLARTPSKPNDSLPRPETLDDHLVAFQGTATSGPARKEAEDALFTALGGGYEPAERLKIVRALVGKVDVTLHSLLAKHLEAILDESLESGDEKTADAARRLLEKIDPKDEAEGQ